MNKKIIVMGSLIIDNVTYTENTGVPGKTVYGESFIQNVGGKGANQAMQCVFLKDEVLFFGARGVDSLGDMASEFLRSNGLRFYLKRVPESTGVANIIVNTKTAQNQIIVIPGANKTVSQKDIDFWTPKIQEGKIFITQLETNNDAAVYALKRAKELGLITILNPAPYSEFDKNYLTFVDYIIPNEYELDEIIGGEESLENKAKELLKFGVKNVIVTLGDKGSMLVNKDEIYYQKPYPVQSVDTTGAGDSFIGGFAHAILHNYSLHEAMDFASRVSSITVTRKGAISSLTKLEELVG